MEALGVVTALLAQVVQRGCVLDALGQGGDSLGLLFMREDVHGANPCCGTGRSALQSLYWFERSLAYTLAKKRKREYEELVRQREQAQRKRAKK